MERDNFEEIIRQKLNRYASDETIPQWEELSKKLYPEAPIRPFYKRYGAIAASLAALLAIPAILITNNEIFDQTSLAVQSVTPEDFDNELRVGDGEEQSAQAFVSDAHTALHLATNNGVVEGIAADKSNTPVSTVTEEYPTVDSFIPSGEPSEGKVEEEDSTPTVEDHSIGEDPEEITKHNLRQFIEDGERAAEPFVLPRRNEKKRFAIGLVASNFSTSKNGAVSGGSRPYHEAILLAYPFPALSLRSEAYNRDLKFNHKVTLTTGVSVSYGLSEKLSIESGLTYSYLSSVFTKESYPGNEGEQELHYLGVPVNILYEFISWKRLRLYAGAGGRVDFNLSANQKSITKGAEVTEHFRDKDPVWSLRGKIGVGVEIIRRLELYAEPGISCFFTESKVRSRWSDHQFNPELQFGLRTSF